MCVVTVVLDSLILMKSLHHVISIISIYYINITHSEIRIYVWTAMGLRWMVHVLKVPGSWRMVMAEGSWFQHSGWKDCRWWRREGITEGVAKDVAKNIAQAVPQGISQGLTSYSQTFILTDVKQTWLTQVCSSHPNSRKRKKWRKRRKRSQRNRKQKNLQLGSMLLESVCSSEPWEHVHCWARPSPSRRFNPTSQAQNSPFPSILFDGPCCVQCQVRRHPDPLQQIRSGCELCRTCKLYQQLSWTN